MRSKEDILKIFGMTNSLITEDIMSIEKRFQVDLDHLSINKNEDDEYFSLFTSDLRYNAKRMSKYYEVFYCIENNIRSLIQEQMELNFGINWWTKENVTPHIYDEVKTKLDKEMDSTFTIRSENEIDYTNFGELGTIITKNWEIFGAFFRSKKSVEKVITSLNSLRGPIAHCGMLAEDEIVRLKLTLRDWFRLLD